MKIDMFVVQPGSVLFFCVYCRPFSIIEGHGFEAVANKFIEIGAKYGKVNAADVLPVATTISRHLSSMYDKQKDLFISTLAEVPVFGVTCDMWTHDSTNASYLTVTVHFINSDWKLVSCILATRHVDESHTQQNAYANMSPQFYTNLVLTEQRMSMSFLFLLFAQFSRKAAFMFAALSVTYTMPL